MVPSCVHGVSASTEHPPQLELACSIAGLHALPRL